MTHENLINLSFDSHQSDDEVAKKQLGFYPKFYMGVITHNKKIMTSDEDFTYHLITSFSNGDIINRTVISWGMVLKLMT